MYWKTKFGQIEREFARNGEKVAWAIVDGFLLYWHPDVYNALDVRIYLRVPEPTLKERRDQRSGYFTAVQSDPEGTMWRDPPQYWENIVYPAFLRAHQDLFENGDVEKGASTGKVPNLIVFNGLEYTMTDMLDRACRRISASAEEELL
ncbi:ribosylnicotinamide kinase [Tulasnella sp. 403]|nr:ribosylnicotinamide kinase [Tulasnella sp. 403]